MNALGSIVAPLGGLVRAWPLVGGVSASVHAVELDTGRVVVVRGQPAAWKDHDDDVVGREFALLQALHALGMPVPEPLRLDGRFMVIAFVEGTSEVTDLSVALEAMAMLLARVHATPVATVSLPQRGEGACLLHGDFWPANILWQDGRVAALLDWEDAAVGDPMSDLAGSRLEVLWAWGEDAMEAYTRHYLDVTGREPIGLATWERYCAEAALESMHAWGLDPEDEASRRAAAEAFVRSAEKRGGR